MNRDFELKKFITFVFLIGIFSFLFAHKKRVENFLTSVNRLEKHRQMFYAQNIYGLANTSTFYFEAPEYETLRDLIAKKSTRVLQIKGALSLPHANKEKKYPALIYVPGRNGAIPFERRKQLAKILQKGMAVFTYSSAVAHGLESYHHKSAFSSIPYAAADLASALKALSNHPNIDPEQIGVFGDCGGGSAVLLTSWKKVLESYNLKNDFKFKIALYPFCYPIDDQAISKANHLILLAQNDEWALPENCATFAQKLSKAGTPLQIVTYAGANHGFDYNMPVSTETPAYPYEHCPWQIALDGTIYSPMNKLLFNTPLEIARARAECGGTDQVKFGGNDLKLIEQSSEDILNFIDKNLILKKESKN